MQSRKVFRVWLPAFALATMVTWLGCEQKGDISPTGSGRGVLSFIETFTVTPGQIGTGDTATVEAHVRTEALESAAGEDVRFSVTRGTLGTGGTQITITTDNAGRARTRYTAPSSPGDTGMVTVQAELLSMGETRSATLRVSDEPVNEGLLTVWAESDTLFADNGASSARIFARLRNEANNPIGGATIHFSTNIGTITSPSITDNTTGVALAQLFSTTETGRAIVTARHGFTTDTVGVLFLAPYEADLIIVSSSRQQLMAGVDTARITAYVYDQGGLPVVDNTVVFFSTTRGTLAALTARTAGGVAATTLMASPNIGDAVISATTGGSVTGSATVQIVPGPASSIYVTSVEDTLYADGNAETSVTSHVTDNFGNPAGQGSQVIFTATGGTVSGTGTIGPDGRASTSFRAGLDIGPATVVAASGSIQGSVTIRLIGTVPASVSLTVNPMILQADGVSQANLRALVVDGLNQPVSNGTSVTFTSQFGIITAGAGTDRVREPKPSPWKKVVNRGAMNWNAEPDVEGSAERAGRLDDGTSIFNTTTTNGYAVATLTSPTETATDIIVATVGSLSDSKSVSYVNGVPATLVLTAASDTLQANGIAVDSITAYVTDAVGHPLSNVEVQFQTTIGNITQSRVTNASGRATVSFTSAQTGVARITATAGAATDQYTVYLIPGLVNSIQMSYYPSSVGVRGSGRNETLLVTATALDANNNPVLDGTLVTFNINGSPGGGDFLSSTDPIPTINGNASVSYNSGTVSGSVRIRAVSGVVSALSTEILIYAGPPYIENIAAGCVTSHMSLSPTPCNMFGMDFVGDSVQLVALVGDRYNNPVPAGTAVYFTTSGGVITTNTGYTDANGFARVTLYSGNPLPTVSRWMNTLTDPNNGGPILCSAAPTRDGMAKVMVSSAGVDANGDSVTVWAATNVVFNYRQPQLNIRQISVNGDPTEREIYIGQSASIRIAAFDQNFWALVDSSTISFSANAGMIYPPMITVGCPGDTSYTINFFNDLASGDEDAATPVLVEVSTRQGGAYAFTETLILRGTFPPGSPLGDAGGRVRHNNGN